MQTGYFDNQNLIPEILLLKYSYEPESAVNEPMNRQLLATFLSKAYRIH